jgi:hypothetical protein
VLLALPAEGFAARTAAILAQAEGHPEKHDPRVIAALRKAAPATMYDAAEALGQVITRALGNPSSDALGDLVGGPAAFPEFNRRAVAEDVFRFVTEHQIVARRDGEAAAKVRERTGRSSRPRLRWRERRRWSRLNSPSLPMSWSAANAIGWGRPCRVACRCCSRVWTRAISRMMAGGNWPRRWPSPRNPLTARVIRESRLAGAFWNGAGGDGRQLWRVR